jgi:DNA repair exonuclease SbcCD ATPase subunit
VICLRLELKNIGGLKGKHVIQFEKGLNLIVARNATGLSSIVSGFRLLVDGSPPKRVLFKDAERGSSSLTLGNESWHASVIRGNSNIVATPSELATKYPMSRLVAIVDEYHPLTYGRLSPEGVAEFLKAICNIERLEANLQDLRVKISADEEKVRGLEGRLSLCDEEEPIRLLAECDELRKTEKELANRIKEAKGSSKPEVLLDKLAAELQREREKKAKIEEEIIKIKGILNHLQAKLDENTKEKQPDALLDALQTRERELKHAIDEIDVKLGLLDQVLKSTIKECPLCSILKVDCGWNTIPPDEITSVFHKTIEMLQKERSSLKNDYAVASETYTEAKLKQNRIKEFESTTIAKMKVHQSRLNELMEQLSVLEAHLKVVGEKSGQARTESQKKTDLIDKLCEEYTLVKAKREAIMKRHNELVNSPLFKNARRNRQELKRLRNAIKTRMEKLRNEEAEFQRILHTARELFNKEAAEFIAATGNREIKFRRIHIDENFRLIMEKEGMDLPVDTDELSTSEATSIAVLLAAIGKKAYYPDFPFFVVDTVSTSYDSASLAKCIEYLLSVAPYLIVTRPMNDVQGIEILHKLPEKAAN